MRRLSKRLQGEKYLRYRNLLVSPATLRLTEQIKRKARHTQVKEDAKRGLRPKHTLVRDQGTQTDNVLLDLLEEDSSDTSTEELICIHDSVPGSYSFVTRTVTFGLTLLFTFITAFVICILIGYYLRVYPVYSRL
jgi:hypothetical protein